jgi:hypothetical protein
VTAIRVVLGVGGLALALGGWVLVSAWLVVQGEAALGLDGLAGFLAWGAMVVVGVAGAVRVWPVVVGRP